MHYEPACNRQEPVVYRIRNLFNGKKYIGSTRNCRSRMQYHINRLRAGKHHCSILQRAFNKHGEKAFVFEIIDCVGRSAVPLGPLRSIPNRRFRVPVRAKD